MFRLILSYSASESPGSLYTYQSESAYQLPRGGRAGDTIEVLAGSSFYSSFFGMSLVREELKCSHRVPCFSFGAIFKYFEHGR